ncbi:MAG: class I SAM-dependent methyltransferase [Proteobacteria bacterium]|nr:class I SAM-dependent methyltransferase [Pseudomonadota bacterium]
MSSEKKTANIWDSFNAKAQDHVLRTVKSRYFPEVWYALENWFQTVKVREVLEVGYGIGLIAEALAKSGWAVTVTEAMPAALDELKERFAKTSLTGTFVASDVHRLPFADHSQEAVVAINTLEFAHDPRAVLREIARVLKPSGRAAIVVLNRYGPWGLPTVSQQLPFPVLRPAARLLTKREFSSLLTTSGLPAAKILERAAYLPFPMPGGVRVKLPLPGAFIALIKNNMGTGRRRSKAEKALKRSESRAKQKPRPTP